MLGIWSDAEIRLSVATVAKRVAAMLILAAVSAVLTKKVGLDQVAEPRIVWDSKAGNKARSRPRFKRHQPFHYTYSISLSKVATVVM